MKISKKIGSLLLLLIIGIIFNACAISDPFNSDKQNTDTLVLNPQSSTTDKYVQKDDTQTKMKKIKDIIYYKQGLNKDYLSHNVGVLTNKNIIHSEIVDNDILPLNLRKHKIDYLDITNKKLGGIIKLIMTQLDGIGLIISPNVNLNKKINMTIKNRNIYQALSDIVEYSGYSLRYSAKKKSLIISEYIEKKYYIPASIFIDRNANISFSSKSITPEFKTALTKSIKDIFLDNLKNIGSSEKLVTLDEQSGIVYVKERALYIKEIDQYISDFVKSRMQQFNVQLAVIELNANKDTAFGIDLQNIISNAAHVSLNSVAGGLPTMTSGVNKDGQNTYTATAGSSLLQGKISMGNKLSFDWLLGALDKRGYSHVVTRPNLLIQNHSIGYISLLNTINYISGWKVTSSDQSNFLTKTPTVSQVEDGMEFMVQINKYPKKDLIQVAAVPSIKSADLGPDIHGEDGVIKMPTEKTISTFSVANIKSGDLIVLSGFKRRSKNNDLSSPLLGKTPLVGKVFNQQTSGDQYQEFVFLIKVTQIVNSKDTFKNPSNKAEQIYRQFN